VNAYEAKAGMVYVADKTALSMPEHLECEYCTTKRVLYMSTYL